MIDSDVNVYIPSFQRSSYIKTPKYLVDMCAFNPENIYIGVQTDDDLDSYRRSELIPEGVNVILTEGAHSVGTNRNFGISRFQGQKVLFMDDDISAIVARDPSEEDEEVRDSEFIMRGCRVRKLNEFGLKRLISTWSTILDGDGVRLVSTNSSARSSVFSTFNSRNRFRESMPFVSTLFMMNCGDLKFDDRLTLCEDYDLAIRSFLRGERCVRDRTYSISTQFRIDRNGVDTVFVPGGDTESERRSDSGSRGDCQKISRSSIDDFEEESSLEDQGRHIRCSR